MYGGVSLAIYTYGVARELADAVQDRCATYRALKALLASDIVVDIVSGTSAGGVNAVLLGRALATGGSMAPCAELWREKADLLALLQEPLLPIKDGADRKLEALFQSKEAYEDELDRALEQIENTDRVESTVRELDVFLTGTDLRGREWKEIDARRQTISVKDHRAVFHLKHRGDGRGKVRKSAFVSHVHQDDAARRAGLAAIARVTSAFPVAFHPVDFQSSAIDGEKPLASYLDLMNRTIRGQWTGERQLIDGGVLDNKPFSHALRPILFRSADRPVERKLFYVDPDPEQFGGEVDGKRFTPDQIAVAALTSLPRYETVADDLQQIRAHNHRVRLIQSLTEALSGSIDPYAELAPDVAQTYAVARAAGIATAIETEISETPLERAFDDADVQAIHRAITSGLDDDVTIDSFDVFREQRRHLHAIYAVYNQFAGKSERASGLQQELLRILFEQLEKLEVAEMALRKLIRTLAKEHEDLLHNPNTERFVVMLAERAQRLLSVEQSGTKAGVLHRDLDARAKSADPKSYHRGLLVEIRRETETRLKEAISQTNEKPLQPFKAWKEFDALDARVYPLHSATGVLEKDYVDLIRISPFDINVENGAGYSWGLQPRDKISGDALFHFGGFVKRSWRSNDIFWGRLDARSILIDSLLDPKRLRLLAIAERLVPAVEAAREELGDLLSEEEASELTEELAKLPRGGEADPIEKERKSAVEEELARFAERAKKLFSRAGARELFLSAAPDVEEDRALDAGATLHEARTRRIRLEEQLEELREGRKLAEVERVGKATVAKLGREDLGDVAPDRVLRLASQTAYLLLRMLRFRFEAAGVKLRIIRHLFLVLERIAATAYLLGRGMELGVRAHALMMAALFAALLASAVMMFLAWKPNDSIWGIIFVAAICIAFEFVRWMLVIRLRSALKRDRT
jgi:predicted acylesterase/phospholipase RssA